MPTCSKDTELPKDDQLVLGYKAIKMTGIVSTFYIQENRPGARIRALNKSKEQLIKQSLFNYLNCILRDSVKASSEMSRKVYMAFIPNITVYLLTFFF